MPIVLFQKIFIPLPMEGFSFDHLPTPPLRNFQFSFILSFKNYGIWDASPPPPQNFQWPPIGWVSLWMDIFWNFTLSLYLKICLQDFLLFLDFSFLDQLWFWRHLLWCSWVGCYKMKKKILIKLFVINRPISIY